MVPLFDTFLNVGKKEEAPGCDALNTIITIKDILMECADSVEARKKYFEEKSLYLLFRNVNSEKLFNFLIEIDMLYKILSVKCFDRELYNFI